MKRVLVYLNFITDKKSDSRAIPETMVNEELVRLIRHVPRTVAEKAFHSWLLTWKEKLDRVA